jgi:hypothetical protein
MLTSDTKRRIDSCRDILVGKLPLPTDQVELITLALIYTTSTRSPWPWAAGAASSPARWGPTAGAS